jgi:hypothetical protein
VYLERDEQVTWGACACGSVQEWCLCVCGGGGEGVAGQMVGGGPAPEAFSVGTCDDTQRIPVYSKRDEQVKGVVCAWV